MSYTVEKTEAFDAWLGGLTDKIAKKAILNRVVRIETGLLGDRSSVGDKVGELRVDVGQGYRLYFTMRARTIVLLLCGGNKKSQKSDIGRAKAMAKARNKEEGESSASRLRDRQSAYAAQGDDADRGEEFSFTEDDLRISRFDAADYMRGDKETQIYLLRNAFADGHPGYIANALGAVARARGLSALERDTGIKRQTLNKSLSPKGNPTLTTLMAVLGALGLRLEVVEDREKGAR